MKRIREPRRDRKKVKRNKNRERKRGRRRMAKYIDGGKT